MKKLLAVIFLAAFVLTAMPAIAQDETTPKCQSVEIVLQHKTMGTTLTLNGQVGIVTEGDGTKRCSTIDEVLNWAIESFPDYTVKEYKELGVKK